MSPRAPDPSPARSALLLTHTLPAQTSDAVRLATAEADQAGCTLYAHPDEFEKHGAAADGIQPLEVLDGPPDVCIVLGGDGTILKALSLYAGAQKVPVLGVNFGTIGFLAAVEREEVGDGVRRALSGDYEVLSLPALVADPGIGERIALNDVSFHRRPYGRVAELSYSLAGKEVGHVRCDGLVAATPVGSTGYNLANQGPILAWGVEGYVVSFIAPHTLTARALVVAPDDVLCVTNAAGRDSVDLVLDGEHVGELPSGAEIEVRFRDDASRLAQLPGANFYRRVRDKFGRLAH